MAGPPSRRDLPSLAAPCCCSSRPSSACTACSPSWASPLGEGRRASGARTSGSTCRAAPASRLQAKADRGDVTPEKLRQARGDHRPARQRHRRHRGRGHHPGRQPGHHRDPRQGRERHRRPGRPHRPAAVPAGVGLGRERAEARRPGRGQEAERGRRQDRLVEADPRSDHPGRDPGRRVAARRSTSPALNALERAGQELRLHQEEPPAGGPRRPAAGHLRHQDR